MRKGVAGPGGLVAVGSVSRSGSADAAVWRSTDGFSWKRVSGGDGVFGGAGDQLINGITTWKGGYVGAGYDRPGTDLDAAVWISADGDAWERVRGPGVFGGSGDQVMNRVAAGPTLLLAVGYDRNYPAVWRSTDGRSWTRASAQPAFAAGGRIRSVTSTNHGFVAVGFERKDGADHPSAWTSPDGRTWTRVTSRAFNVEGAIITVVPGGPGVVGVGFEKVQGRRTRAAAWTSVDGSRWNRAAASQEAFSSPGDQEMDVVISTPQGLVAGGLDGDRAALWSSANGSAWTETSDLPAFASDRPMVVSGLALLGEDVVAVGWSGSGANRDATAWVLR